MMFSQPTPELPVPDVRVAQEYYRDTLGFEISWYNEDGKIGAVAHGDCAIFFREAPGEHPGQTFWVYCEDLEGKKEEGRGGGEKRKKRRERKPGGLWQFTVQDQCGNKFDLVHEVGQGRAWERRCGQRMPPTSLAALRHKQNP